MGFLESTYVTQLGAKRHLGLFLFLGVAGAALGVLVVLLVGDVALSALRYDDLLDSARRTGMASAMGGLAEVLAAVLGLSLTVVAIVVQLASARYPAKIVDLFMFDRINIGTFAFMAASCVYSALVPTFVTGERPPVIAASAALLLVVVNFGLLLPYFGYVFAFLEPRSIISQIASGVRTSFAQAAGAGPGLTLTAAQRRVSEGIDRIADNCMAAVGQSDRNLALHSIRTLEQLLSEYETLKAQLPAEWSQADPSHFGTLSAELTAEIIANHTWVEARVLLEFERIVRRALEHMNEVTTQLASSTRAIGEAALRRGDRDTLELSVQFMNTYVRHAINRGNVRAVYNIFYEYRLFAETMLEAGDEIAARMVEHLVYYGRLGNTVGLPFVTVTAAHDVRVVCERAYDLGDANVEALLDLFLTLDQTSEGKSEEVALINVRKAQSILGAFLLHRGAEALVRAIREDLSDESAPRLQRIRDEILGVTEHKFWEITDRGFNFDYVAPELRPRVTEFFEPLLAAS